MKKKKPFSFWKPVKHKTPLNLKPKKDLTWKEAKRRYPKLKPFGDADGDGKKNKFDCKPFDKKRHKYTKGPGGNYRWSATIPEMKKHYRQLRKAGIPADQARVIRSWRPTKVKAIVEGREIGPLNVGHDYKEYQKQYRKSEKYKQYQKQYRERKKEVLEVPKDSDGDLVVDKADCEPYNPEKQGFMHMVNQKSKRSLKKFEKYKPQVQRIVTRLERERKADEAAGFEIMKKFQNNPPKMMRELGKIDKRAQPENIAYYDFASIPGIKSELEFNKTTPVHLIVEKGIVKGEAVFKRKSPDTIETKSIYILPEYRKQRLGTKVIRSIFKNPQITKKVGVSAVNAKPWHMKLGAKQTGSEIEKEIKREHKRGVSRHTVKMLLEHGAIQVPIPEDITDKEREEITEQLIDWHQANLKPAERAHMETTGWENTLTKEDFEKNIGRTFYHGTSKLHVPSIKKEGLKISKTKAGIFLTPDKETAQRYARENAFVLENSFNGGAVAEVILPPNLRKYAEMDKFKKDPLQKYMDRHGYVQVAEDIPPEYIEFKGEVEEPAPEVLEKFEPEEYKK